MDKCLLEQKILFFDFKRENILHKIIIHACKFSHMNVFTREITKRIFQPNENLSTSLSRTYT